MKKFRLCRIDPEEFCLPGGARRNFDAWRHCEIYVEWQLARAGYEDGERRCFVSDLNRRIRPVLIRKITRNRFQRPSQSKQIVAWTHQFQLSAFGEYLRFRQNER